MLQEQQTSNIKHQTANAAAQNDPQLQALKEERKAERKKQKGKKLTKEEKAEKKEAFNSSTRGVGSH